MLYENRYGRYLERNEIDVMIKKGEITFDEVDQIVFKDTKRRCLGCGEFLGDNDQEKFCPACMSREQDAFEKDQTREDYNGKL